MTNEARKDWRFYVCIIMGFIIIIIGIICPPLGEVASSLLWASAMFNMLAGGIVGLDIPAILHEIRLLRNNIIESEIKDKEDDVLHNQRVN